MIPAGFGDVCHLRKTVQTTGLVQSDNNQIGRILTTNVVRIVGIKNRLIGRDRDRDEVSLPELGPDAFAMGWLFNDLNVVGHKFSDHARSMNRLPFLIGIDAGRSAIRADC